MWDLIKALCGRRYCEWCSVSAWDPLKPSRAERLYNFLYPKLPRQLRVLDSHYNLWVGKWGHRIHRLHGRKR